jgi:hypothetical protein
MNPRSLRFSAAGLVTTLALVVTLAVPAAAAGKASDSSIAKQGVLRITDFPSGWTQSAHKDSKPTGLPSCKGTEQASAKNKKYRAQSPDFAQGDTASAYNAVYVFPKPAQAIAYLRPFQATATTKCLQQGTAKALRKVKGATVQVQQLDLSSAIKAGTIDDAVGYEVLVTVPQQGQQPVPLYLVAVAVRIGRSVTGFTTQNANEVLPDTDNLINASLGRLKTALG